MSDASLDVVGVGNAIVDVIGKADLSDVRRLGLTKGAMTLIEAADADRLYPEMGMTIETSGGSAANTLAALASLGGRGAFIGKVCDDRFGDVFRNDMTSIGVDYRLRAATGGPPTARCLVFVTPDADRTMQTFLGASVLLGPDDIDPEAVGDARVTYLEGYLFDREPAKEAFVKAAEIAHAAGRKVALTLSDPFCVDRHRAAFRHLVEGHIDILFANRDEIVSLYLTDSFEQAVDSVAGRVETAAITCGAEGSVIVSRGERIEIAATPAGEVVDTTGAGDLYAAGVLYGMTRGYELETAGRIGAICAAEIIGRYGARPAEPLSGIVETVIGRGGGS